ncbi:hypothetical protein BSKO_11789 [Bryopsis sp. KO-2023]|nr:hypothetical protein BSKO_11789 [Bryopsis sp. KO-2023]
MCYAEPTLDPKHDSLAPRPTCSIRGGGNDIILTQFRKNVSGNGYKQVGDSGASNSFSLSGPARHHGPVSFGGSHDARKSAKMDPGTLCSESNGATCTTCGTEHSEEQILLCKNSIWSGKWPGCFGAIHVRCVPLEVIDETGPYVCDPCGKLHEYTANAQFCTTEEEIDFSQICFDGECPVEVMDGVTDRAVEEAPNSPSTSGGSSDGGIQRRGKKKLRRLSSGPPVLSQPRKPPQGRANIANRRSGELLQPQQSLPIRRSSQDPSLMKKMKTVGKNIQPRQRHLKVPKGRALPENLERVDQVASGTTMLKAGGSGMSRYLHGQETARKNTTPARRGKKPNPGAVRVGVTKPHLQRPSSLDRGLNRNPSKPADSGFVPYPPTNAGNETPPYNPWEDNDPFPEQDPCTSAPAEKPAPPLRQPPASWGKPLASSSAQMPASPFSVQPRSTDDDRLNAFKARLGASKSTVASSGGGLSGRLSSDPSDRGRGNGGGNYLCEDNTEVPEECNRLTKAAANEKMKKDGQKKEAFNFCSFLNDQLGAEVAQGVISNKAKEEQLYVVHRDHLWNGMITFKGIPEVLPPHLEEVGPVSISSVPVFFPILGCDINTVKKIFDEDGKPLHATLRRKFDLEWLIQEDKYKELDKHAQLEVEAPSSSCRPQMSLIQKHMEMEELVGCCISRRHPELDLYLFPGVQAATLVGFVRYNWTGKQIKNTWKGILKKTSRPKKLDHKSENPNHVIFRCKERAAPTRRLLPNHEKAPDVVLEPRKPRDQKEPRVSERATGSVVDLAGVKKPTLSQPPPEAATVPEEDSRTKSAFVQPSTRGNESPAEMDIATAPDSFPPHLRPQASQAPPPPTQPPPPPLHSYRPQFQPPAPLEESSHYPSNYHPQPPLPRGDPSQFSPDFLPPPHEYHPFPPQNQPPPPPPPPPPYGEHPHVPTHYPPPPPRSHGDFHQPAPQPPPPQQPPPPPPRQEMSELTDVPAMDNVNCHLANPDDRDAMAVDHDPYSPREGADLPLPGQPPLPGSPIPEPPPVPEPPLRYPRVVQDLCFTLIGYRESQEEWAIIEQLTSLGAKHIIHPLPNKVNLVSFNERLQSSGFEGHFAVREYLDYEVVFLWGLQELWASIAPSPPYNITIRREAMCFPSGVLVVADKFALSSCTKQHIHQIIECLKEGYRKMPSCLWKFKVSNKCWQELLLSRHPETMSVLDYLWTERADPRAPRSAERVFEFMQPQDQSSKKGKAHPPQVVRDAVKMAFTNRDKCRFVYLVHGNLEETPEDMRSEPLSVKVAAEGQHTIQIISIPDLSKKIKWIVQDRGYC